MSKSATLDPAPPTVSDTAGVDAAQERIAAAQTRLETLRREQEQCRVDRREARNRADRAGMKAADERARDLAYDLEIEEELIAVAELEVAQARYDIALATMHTLQERATAAVVTAREAEQAAKEKRAQEIADRLLPRWRFNEAIEVDMYDARRTQAAAMADLGASKSALAGIERELRQARAALDARRQQD